jgi:hypothetical protein
MAKHRYNAPTFSWNVAVSLCHEGSISVLSDSSCDVSKSFAQCSTGGPHNLSTGCCPFLRCLSVMQLHQIELVPGESIRVGHLIVTLITVEGNLAQLHVEDADDDNSWSDPESLLGCDLEEPVLV